MAFSISGVSTVCSAAVRIAPGAIALTRIPIGPRSKAMLRVRWLAAALDDPYEAMRTLRFSPAIELMLRIAPPPARARCGAHNCDRLKIENTLSW